MTKGIDMIVRKMAEEFERVLGVKIEPEQREAVERQIMDAFGGERVYVPKKRATQSPGQVLADGFGHYHARQAVRDIMRQHRVSQATAYRMLRRAK
jgi:Mor family transcriptional regulator